MALVQRLDLKQSQSLVMTPQLRQAIQLLQFSNIEATQFVDEELQKNPLLERAEPEAAEAPASPGPLAPVQRPDADSATLADAATLPSAADMPLDYDFASLYDPGVGDAGGSAAAEDDGWSAVDGVGAAKPSLVAYLEQQAGLAFGDPLERGIAGALIAGLDENGRLDEPPETIAAMLGVPLARLEAVRASMMRFDPTGLFAVDLAECLRAQLAEQNRFDPAMAALIRNLPLLARREMRQLQEVCGVDAADLAEMVAELRRLNPKPVSAYETEAPRPLIPDVLMRRMPIRGSGVADWILEINPETMPRLLVRRGFHARIVASASRETKSFLSEQLQSATWLVKALESRAQTILRVSAEIVRRQDGFFAHGISHLRPLTLRDIASEVDLHESTISRVTSNKSIATPRGIFELKFFFTTALSGANGQVHSAETVRHRVQSLIFGETPSSILSDDAVATILQEEGIDIARRTVAKYREALRIPGSAQRKREKAPA